MLRCAPRSIQVRSRRLEEVAITTAAAAAARGGEGSNSRAGCACRALRLGLGGSRDRPGPGGRGLPLLPLPQLLRSYSFEAAGSSKSSTMEAVSAVSAASGGERPSPSGPITPCGPLERTIREKLAAAFHPVAHLDVINESHMHNVPRHSETHFKVVVVSGEFDGVPVIQRHRRVNSVLADELQRAGGIHALSIVAKTPAQWSEMVRSNRAAVEPSPKCRGGDGSLPSRKDKPI